MLASHSPLSCLRRAGFPGLGAGSSSGVPGGIFKGQRAEGTSGPATGLPAFPSWEERVLAFHAKKFGLDPAFAGKAHGGFLHFLLPLISFNLIHALSKYLNRTTTTKRYSEKQVSLVFDSQLLSRKQPLLRCLTYSFRKNVVVYVCVLRI